MPDPYQEFCDQMMHRSYPLTDASGGLDSTGQFRLPTSLVTDIYLCAPDLPFLNYSKFYISRVTIRQFNIDIEISYDDPSLTTPLGVFQQIKTSAPLQECYLFTPYSAGAPTGILAPLYFMTGQVCIGDAREAARSIGSWEFTQDTDQESTWITPTRIGRGVLSVQHIMINDRVYTGSVRLREGQNVRLDTDTEIISGVPHTVITVNASFQAGSPDINLASDADVLTALTNLFGVPVQTINGLQPDVNRNFQIEGADCITIAPLTTGIEISNPCATPCCDENDNVDDLQQSIANLNLRYAQLHSFFEALSKSINATQQKLLVLGAEV